MLGRNKYNNNKNNMKLMQPASSTVTFDLYQNTIFCYCEVCKAISSLFVFYFFCSSEVMQYQKFCLVQSFLLGTVGLRLAI